MSCSHRTVCGVHRRWLQACTSFLPILTPPSLFVSLCTLAPCTVLHRKIDSMSPSPQLARKYPNNRTQHLIRAGGICTTSRCTIVGVKFHWGGAMTTALAGVRGGLTSPCSASRPMFRSTTAPDRKPSAKAGRVANVKCAAVPHVVWRRGYSGE
jgi:hypothetical protein